MKAFILLFCTVLPILYGEDKSAQVGDAPYWEGGLVWINVSADLDYRGNKTVYRLYQSPDYVVRLEAVSFENHPSSGVGSARDVHLLDYRQGIRTSYDKGKSRAERWRLQEREIDPFVGGEPIGLGKLRILEMEARGAQGTTKIPESDQTERWETWVATDNRFKIPLLEIRRSYTADNRLVNVSLKMVTTLRTVNQLDPNLFVVPPKYTVFDIQVNPR